MIFEMGTYRTVEVIDSHTEGEPTRVVVSGGPNLGTGPLSERLERFRTEFDAFRSAVVCEPRGSEVVVGALLLEPVQLSSRAAVIFFNDVGYLGMCGHGTIGVVTTLAHLGRIGPGEHRIETPVGIVSTRLDGDGSVTVANVASYRYKAGVAVDVPGLGSFVGDIAYGGNWFFLVGNHPYELTLANRTQLIAASSAIRAALHANGITGPNGESIDHVEFFLRTTRSAELIAQLLCCVPAHRLTARRAAPEPVPSSHACMPMASLHRTKSGVRRAYSVLCFKAASSRSPMDE